MRIVIQRVSSASVTIEGTVKSSIQQGYVILLGVCEEDSMEDVEWLVKKVIGLRVFNDEQGVMNRCIMDVGGEVLSSASLHYLQAIRRGIARLGSRQEAMSILSHSTKPSANVSASH